MSTLLAIMFGGVVTGCGAAPRPAVGDERLWGRISSLLEEGASTRDPELVEYLKSLTPQQMLAAAREACEEGASDTRLPSDELRLEAAVSNALVCLEYYFDSSNTDEAVRMLFERAADPGEHPWFRFALVGCTGGVASRHRFGTGLQRYTLTQWAEVESLLSKMLSARQQDACLRKQIVKSLSGALHRQFWAACRADPNIRRALEEGAGQGSEILQVIDLVKSGDVHLDEATWQVLKPIVARIHDNIRLLSSINADRDNEAEPVREQARRSLERYRGLPLLDLDEEIDKALRQAAH